MKYACIVLMVVALLAGTSLYAVETNAMRELAEKVFKCGKQGAIGNLQYIYGASVTRTSPSREIRRYATVFYVRVDKSIYPMRIDLVEEEWVAVNDTYVITQLVGIDYGIDGIVDNIYYRRIIEDKQGTVLSMEDLPPAGNKQKEFDKLYDRIALVICGVAI
jgi:hypothetical protein